MIVILYFVRIHMIFRCIFHLSLESYVLNCILLKHMIMSLELMDILKSSCVGGYNVDKVTKAYCS